MSRNELERRAVARICRLRSSPNESAADPMWAVVVALLYFFRDCIRCAILVICTNSKEWARALSKAFVCILILKEAKRVACAVEDVAETLVGKLEEGLY